MRLVRHLDQCTPESAAWSLAVGSFDGVHRGHQAVLARAAQLGGPVCVGLRMPRPRPALTSFRHQLQLLEQCGAQRIVVLREDESSASLVATLGSCVWVTGAPSAAPPGCRVELVPAVCADGRRLEAASLRMSLASGDLADVSRGLGRAPGVEGRVVHGFHRGASLGIPTANLLVRDVALPPDGVYAVQARVAGASLRAVANVGFNPTFGNRARSVETHVLDFSGDIYGQRLEIAFTARLRGERKFESIDALLAQIRADIEAARAIFGQQQI